MLIDIPVYSRYIRILECKEDASYSRWIFSLACSVAGYGFVDFELAEDAEHAVTALQSRGIQAQMAKVRWTVRVEVI